MAGHCGFLRAVSLSRTENSVPRYSPIFRGTPPSSGSHTVSAPSFMMFPGPWKQEGSDLEPLLRAEPRSVVAYSQHFEREAWPTEAESSQSVGMNVNTYKFHLANNSSGSPKVLTFTAISFFIFLRKFCFIFTCLSIPPSVPPSLPPPVCEKERNALNLPGCQ